MGRWLNRLRADEKNEEMPLRRTDKTDETSETGVLSVLSVPQKRDPAFFDDAYDAFEERAAILEYDEGLPRAEAERLAAEQMANILPFRRGA